MKDRRVEVAALAREGPSSEAPICRVGEGMLAKLRSAPGDLVEIRGRRSAAAKLVLVQGLGDGVCEVDPQRLAQAGIEGEASVRLAATPRRYARRVILSPDTAVLDMIALEDGDPSLVGLPVVRGSTLHNPVTGKTAFVIRETFPSGVVCLGPNTHYSIIKPGKAEKSRQVSSLDLGGMRHEIHRLRDLFELALRKPEVFDNLGLDGPKVFLLSGPAGAGKSVLVEALAFEVKASKLVLSFPRIAMATKERPASVFARTLEEAKRNLPALLVLEDVDADLGGEAVEAACSLLAEVRSRARMAAVLTCRAPEKLSRALAGQCEDVTALPLPDLAEREEILRVAARHIAMQDVAFDDIAAATSGAVAGDLIGLLKEAVLVAYQEAVDEARPETSLVLSSEHFAVALRRFVPSGRELAPSCLSLPGGFAAVLADGAVLDHARNLLLNLDAPRPRGVLLSGPAGSGKSTFVAGLAFELIGPLPCLKASPLVPFEDGLRALKQRLARGEGGMFCIEDADRLGRDERELLRAFLFASDPRWQALVTAREPAALGGLLAPGCLEAELALAPPDAGQRERFFSQLFAGLELKRGLSHGSMAGATEGLWPEQLARVAKKAVELCLAEAGEDLPRLGNKTFKAALAAVTGNP